MCVIAEAPTQFMRGTNAVELRVFMQKKHTIPKNVLTLQWYNYLYINLSVLIFILCFRTMIKQNMSNQRMANTS
jgi:hypothetical protein